jgi:hypothetical protein
VSFEAAMQQIAPQIMLVDSNMAQFHNNYDAHSPAGLSTDPIWAYLAQRHAHLLRSLRDNYGQPFEIYQVNN